MNKYLLLSAVAAVATTGVARIAAASTIVNLNGYCDYFIMHNNHHGVWAAQHVGAVSCGTSVYNDPGINTNLFFQGSTISARHFNYRDTNTRSPSTAFADNTFVGVGLTLDGLIFLFTRPFGHDGYWSILASTSGSTTFVLGGGRQTAKATPGAKTSSVAKALSILRAK